MKRLLKIFTLGAICLVLCGAGWSVARGAESKLRTWTRAEASVRGVRQYETRSARGRRRMKCETTVAYDTPGGPALATLRERIPGDRCVIYYDSANVTSPASEQSLKNQSGPLWTTGVHALGAAGIGLLCFGGYATRRALRGASMQHHM
jgi:hypothetical protein